MTQFSRKKIISQKGVDLTPIDTRITNLEQNEYKVTYYEIISGASGSITLPTGATINAGEFGLSGNCILSKIDGSNKPTFESPKTSGGTIVTASLNETTGAWVASGTYTDANVALIYSIKIKAVYYGNLTYNNIIETAEVGVEIQSNKQNSLSVDGTGTKYPTVDAVNDGFEKGLKIIYSDFTTGSNLTGTTAITLINSALIPANSFIVNDELELRCRAQRDTLTGTATNYVYINTSNTLAGATLIGFQSAAGGYYALQRNLFIKSTTNTETSSSSLNLSSSDVANGGSATSMSSLNIDWTVDQYIIQAFANAAVGNNTTSRGLIVNRFRK